MRVKDILESKKRRGQILSVRAEDAVDKAIKIMVENDTGSVAVYENDTFLDMMTFRKILQALHSNGFAGAANLTCRDLMEQEGHCVTPDESVDQVRNLMTQHHIRYLPVVQDGKLTDVISFYDVARTVAKAADFENRMLKEYISNWPGGDPDAQ